MGDRAPMLMSIQNPERVLNILRSSTLTSRLAGMGRAVRRAGAASVVVAGGTIVAGLPQLPRVGGRRGGGEKSLRGRGPPANRGRGGGWPGAGAPRPPPRGAGRGGA